jgi:two-component system LytT family response regulator
MHPLKAIIIDDERLGREIIKRYLLNIPGILLSGECTNGFEGIKMIQEIQPDIIFLDVQMPKITGFEMLEVIDNPPVIIFTTAYDEYAIKAFEVSAADYLLKPFTEERFRIAVEKALKLVDEKKNNKGAVERILSSHEHISGYSQRIIIKNGNKISVIPVEDIKWIQAQDDYVMIYTESGKFLKEKTMASLEETLNPSEFVRIHRSYIIRLAELSKIMLMEKDTYKALLKDQTSLPVSKTGYNKLKELLK